MGGLSFLSRHPGALSCLEVRNSSDIRRTEWIFRVRSEQGYCCPCHVDQQYPEDIQLPRCDERRAGHADALQIKTYCASRQPPQGLPQLQRPALLSVSLFPGQQHAMTGGDRVWEHSHFRSLQPNAGQLPG